MSLSTTSVSQSNIFPPDPFLDRGLVLDVAFFCDLGRE
jgi:hypothetical protein